MKNNMIVAGLVLTIAAIIGAGCDAKAVSDAARKSKGSMLNAMEDVHCHILRNNDCWCIHIISAPDGTATTGTVISCNNVPETWRGSISRD